MASIEAERERRWLPRHGKPFRVIDKISQTSIKALASPPVYTAIVGAAVLAIEFLHPLGLGQGW